MQEDFAWFASAWSLLVPSFVSCLLSLWLVLAFPCLCSVAYVPRGYGCKCSIIMFVNRLEVSAVFEVPGHLLHFAGPTGGNKTR